MLAAALAGSAPAAAAEPASTPIAPAAAASEPVTLLAKGADWRWHYSPSAWDAGWQAPGYDDSSWRDGTAPLGWGPDARTRTSPEGSPARKPLSIQFRTEFTVTDVDALADITLSFRADDGAVVYVNGKEITRQNLPSKTLSATTYATKAPNSKLAARLHTVTVPASALRDGTKGLLHE